MDGEDQWVIGEVSGNRKEYLDLLLLADEQENMIDRYLDRGWMYVMKDRSGNGPAAAVCVVTDEGKGVLEIKNLAVRRELQGRGLGRRMVEFAADRFRGRFQILQVGTGDSPLTLPFYKACGFAPSHVVKNFFTDHYDHPIWEGGVLLQDMVYLRREL